MADPAVATAADGMTTSAPPAPSMTASAQIPSGRAVIVDRERSLRAKAERDRANARQELAAQSAEFGALEEQLEDTIARLKGAERDNERGAAQAGVTAVAHNTRAAKTKRTLFASGS